jgi:hypothetical protein
MDAAHVAILEGKVGNPGSCGGQNEPSSRRTTRIVVQHSLVSTPELLWTMKHVQNAFRSATKFLVNGGVLQTGDGSF